MDNKEFSKLLEKRTRDFALRIIKLSAALPNTPEGREIRRQITNRELPLGRITARRTEPEAEPISKVR
jgi:hypothetical protein